MIKRLFEWLDDWEGSRRDRDATKIIHAMSQMEEVQLTDDDWPRWHYSLDVMRAAEMSAGRFFSAIYMLEEYGVVEGMFEPGDYPRRRFYRFKDLTSWDR